MRWIDPNERVLQSFDLSASNDVPAVIRGLLLTDLSGLEGSKTFDDLSIFNDFKGVSTVEISTLSQAFQPSIPLRSVNMSPIMTAGTLFDALRSEDFNTRSYGSIQRIPAREQKSFDDSLIFNHFQEVNSHNFPAFSRYFVRFSTFRSTQVTSYVS